MSLTDHIKTLDKRDLDKFAIEYYGVQLDRRKSKEKMEKQLLDEVYDKDPLKPLPWEELLLETDTTSISDEGNSEDIEILDHSNLVVTEETNTEELIITNDDEHNTQKDVPVVPEINFEPSWTPTLTCSRGVYYPINWQVLDRYLAGDRTSQDSQTIEYWIRKNGKLIVRESRNSRFIELTD